MNQQKQMMRVWWLLPVLLGMILPGTSLADYEGTVRLYVVEPSSRWDDRNGDPFEYGCVDIPLEADISISAGSPWQHTMTWDGTAIGLGLGSVSQSNIMVMAAVFNANGEVRDAVPGSGNYFTAYPVDASAAAYPGLPGQNSTEGGYTHTVFLEEGTLTT